MDQKQLADLLHQDAPPALDSRFRLAVLERRARQFYRRRLAATSLAALVCVLELLIAINASAAALETGAFLIASAGLVASWFSYAPVLGHWIRTSKQIIKNSPPASS